jgi:hypothetical protein
MCTKLTLNLKLMCSTLNQLFGVVFDPKQFCVTNMFFHETRRVHAAQWCKVTPTDTYFIWHFSVRTFINVYVK